MDTNLLEKKSRSLLRSIFQAAFSIYFFLAVVVFAPYFNWRYAHDHGFVSWLCLGEAIPTAKALVWPFFLDRGNGTAKHFVQAVKYHNEAVRIVKGGRALTTVPDSDIKEILRYLNLALR